MTIQQMHKFILILTFRSTSRDLDTGLHGAKQPEANLPMDKQPLDQAGDRATIDYDQKSYSYCHFDSNRNSTDFPASSKQKQRTFNRQSYDVVEHNRGKSTDFLDVDVSNPYNHVTLDMEVTEYDSANHVKPRVETKDPTYSHITKVKKENEASKDTTKICTCDQSKKKGKAKKKEKGNRKGTDKNIKSKSGEETNPPVIPQDSKTVVEKRASKRDPIVLQKEMADNNINEFEKQELERELKPDQMIKAEIFQNGFEDERNVEIERKELPACTELQINTSSSSVNEISETSTLLNTLHESADDQEEAFFTNSSEGYDVVADESIEEQAKSTDIRESERKNNYFILSRNFDDFDENIPSVNSGPVSNSIDDEISTAITYKNLGFGRDDTDFLSWDENADIKGRGEMDRDIELDAEYGIEDENDSLSNDDICPREAGMNRTYSTETVPGMAVNILYEDVSIDNDGKIFVGDVDISSLEKPCNSEG